MDVADTLRWLTHPPGTERPGEGRGFVYVLSNRFIPGLLKIGVTTGPVATRAADLFTTGVPFPFEIELYAEVENPQRAEQEIHRVLARRRSHINREFFQLDPAEAERVVRMTLGLVEAAGSRTGSSKPSRGFLAG